jgi:tetratricopeptide (TPR) repeat protein
LPHRITAAELNFRIVARRPLFTFAVTGLVAVTVPAARAHGPYHQLIGAANHRVATHPDDPQALIQRAELRRAHGDHQEALADLGEAARLGAAQRAGDELLLRVDLLRGRTLVEGGQPRMARTYLDRVVAKRPDSAPALQTRARALTALGEHAAAAADHERALPLIANPTPDDYLARAHAQIAAGRKGQAVRGLDEGIARLGPLPTLHLLAIDLDVAARRWDSALARLAALAAQSPRQETFHHRRGEILLAAGRRADARAAFQAALDAIAALPPHLRGTPAVNQLEEKARTALGEARRKR